MRLKSYTEVQHLAVLLGLGHEGTSASAHALVAAGRDEGGHERREPLLLGQLLRLLQRHRFGAAAGSVGGDGAALWAKMARVRQRGLGWASAGKQLARAM